ncbi:MAG: AAA family ATPase [Polaromonas sp.]
MLIEQLTLTNLLSFGPQAQTITLQPLSVFIGPNGSGKSNLLEAVDLLRSAPEQLAKPIREGGGVADWLWKGEPKSRSASIDAVLRNATGPASLRYVMSFAEAAQRFQVVDERIEKAIPDAGHKQAYLYYNFQGGHPVLNIKGHTRKLQHEDIDVERSILAQRRDPDQYPEITYLATVLPRIRLYREWSFGRYTPPRLPQKADLPNEHLEPDASNLGLVLNRLRRDPQVKQKLLKALRALYDGIDDFDVQIEGGTVQVFFQEGRFVVPATRLSDGTLRYLCLLAILCHPSPPPLVCIEEPELGLHPDILPTLAALLREAAERTQVIVTTHSDILVDAMTDTPESVYVCEKQNGQTTVKQLSQTELAPWLERYRLGELWTRGEIGGTRW